MTVDFSFLGLPWLGRGRIEVRTNIRVIMQLYHSLKGSMTISSIEINFLLVLVRGILGTCTEGTYFDKIWYLSPNTI